MSEHSLIPRIVFEVGPVQVSETVVYSCLVSGLLVGFALLTRVGLTQRPTRWQIAAEFVIEHFEGVLRDMLGGDPRPYIPLIATLALYIGTANLFGLVPGMRSPTADFSTTAALACVVFLAVPYYGIRARGWLGYFKHYLQPTPLMLPLELISEFSRTLALAVRLFGNVISEELVIAVLLGLAGVLVPVPMMLLSILTGLVQAYIFAVLSVVYLSAAVRAQHEAGDQQHG